MKSVFLFFIIIFTFFHSVSGQIAGCTDPLANNYNASAEINDGSCAYNNASISVSESWILPDVMMETSGLIHFDNSILTQNDDTDINLYRINPSNVDDFQAYNLAGITNTDMEDIAQDENYIYLGDFGNNVNGNRTDLHILRIEKNSLLNNTPQIDTIWFSYSLQTDFSATGSNNTDFDCEALIASSDSLYLFTKEWVSEKTSLYVLPKTPGIYNATFRSNINVQGLITGAEYFEEKRLVVLSGYSSLLQPFIYLLYDFQSDDFFLANKRKIAVNLPFHQVEGITSNDGLNYYISNEKLVQVITINQKLHTLNLSNYLEDYLNSICDLPNAAGTISGAENVCGGDTNLHYYINPVNNADEYLWTLPNGITGASSTNEILLSFAPDCESDYISVSGVNSCGIGSESTFFVEVNPKPETPQIYFDGESLISNALEGNQWYNENGEIEGANSPSLIITEDGYYYCIINTNNCYSDTSNIEHVIVSGNNRFRRMREKVLIFPNPASESIYLQIIDQQFQTAKIEILNNHSKTMLSKHIESSNERINITDFPVGMYILRMYVNNSIISFKFSVNR